MKILSQFLQIQALSRTLGIFLLGNMMLLGTQLTVTLRDISDGKLELNYLWGVISLALISQSGFLFGACYFLSLLFLLANLYNQNEIYAMCNIGVSDKRLFAWLFIPTGFVAASVGILVFSLTPLSVAQIDNIYSSQLLHKIDNIQDGSTEFIDNIAFRVRGEHLEIWRINKEATEFKTGILGGETKISSQDGLVQIPFSKGKIINWRDNDSVLQTDFSEAIFNIQLGFTLSSPVQAKPTMQLYQGSPDDRAELYQRIAMFLSPFTALPLALLCSRRRVRSAKFINIFSGILLYFFYLILIISSIGIIRNGGDALFFWLIQGAFNAIIIALLFSPNLLWRFNFINKRTKHASQKI